MMLVTKKNSHKGQTLLEVLVTMSAVALFLAGLVSAILIAAKAARISRDRTRAIALVEEKMTQIRQERDTDPGAFWGRSGLSSESLSGGFIRTADYTQLIAGESMEVEIIVYRTDAAGDRQLASAISRFTNWLEP